jgi:signal transduction histidine kinase
MDTKIFLVLLATAFVFLILIFLVNFILSYQKKTIAFTKEKELMQARFDQTLLQSQIEVQEATFSVLARELHDNIGQLLSSSKMLLGITQRNIEVPPETLTIAEETLGKAIGELRSLSKSLDKEWLEQFDLIDNLTTEINRINAGLVLEIHFSHPGRLTLAVKEQIILFRIIQEALQNAIKHAEAKNISIEIETLQSQVHINITDDGSGFKPIYNNGLGIRNMKHRTKLLGGNISWTNPGLGTTINIQLPLKPETK